MYRFLRPGESAVDALPDLAWTELFYNSDIPTMLYQPRLHIVLYQPEIPHNTGSVGRTCVALQGKLWLVRPLGFRVDDYHLRRAGLDYWERLVWQDVASWEQLTEQLSGQRFWYFTKTAERCFWDVAFNQGDVLVFGCESSGLPSQLLTQDPEACLRIPIPGEVRSLNLSNSVAVAAYEAARQWSVASA